MTGAVAESGAKRIATATSTFRYSYEVEISAAVLRHHAHHSGRIPVTYVQETGAAFPWKFTESTSGFQRKLLFNFLSAMDSDPDSKHTIQATYYYVVAEKNEFAF